MQYLIGDVIGSGGMAEVRVGQLPGHEPVALKRVRLDDPELRARLRAEAEVLRAVRHPNLVELRGFIEQDGDEYLVLELVDGVTLREILSFHGPLEPEIVAFVGARIAAAIARLHEVEIVHRDVCPSNILLSRDGIVKLADLGLARWEGVTPATRHGGIIGREAYLPPEYLSGGRAEPSLDVFSLGRTLIELATGSVGSDASQLGTTQSCTAAPSARPSAAALSLELASRAIPSDEAEGILSVLVTEARPEPLCLGLDVAPARRPFRVAALASLAVAALVAVVVGSVQADEVPSARDPAPPPEVMPATTVEAATPTPVEELAPAVGTSSTEPAPVVDEERDLQIEQLRSDLARERARSRRARRRRPVLPEQAQSAAQAPASVPIVNIGDVINVAGDHIRVEGDAVFRDGELQ